MPNVSNTIYLFPTAADFPEEKEPGAIYLSEASGQMWVFNGSKMILIESGAGNEIFYRTDSTPAQARQLLGLGDIYLDGQHAGQVQGFSFTMQPTMQSAPEAKANKTEDSPEPLQRTDRLIVLDGDSV